MDVGERRIGVSISDPSGIVVTPLAAVQRTTVEADLKAVLEIAEAREVSTIVVGLPISLNGTIGPQARLVNRFIRELSRASSVPVHSQDERFSTVEAERLLHQAGHQPSREKGLRDSASACVILQAYLESKRHA